MSKPIKDNEFGICTPNLNSAMRWFEDRSPSPDVVTSSGFDPVDPTPTVPEEINEDRSPSRIRKLGKSIMSNFDGMAFGYWR